MSNPSIHTFHHVLRSASKGIESAMKRNDEMLEKIIPVLSNIKGKIIVTGIGKSSIIAQKMAATFSSTGSPAIFLHAGEAFHGDLGICETGDVAIVISKSGTTNELVKLVPYFKNIGIMVIGLLGNTSSPLGISCDFVLDASVESEADQHNIVPSSSTTLALTMGDALAICMMELKGFSSHDFARFHPGGQLGKNLLHTVNDHMIHVKSTPMAQLNSSLKEVIISMTENPVGACCVINGQNELLGLITDGDIRRFLVKNDEIRDVVAADIMTKNPVEISSDKSIMQAIDLMENRSSQISVLPVVDNGKLVGVIRIHDAYL